MAARAWWRPEAARSATTWQPLWAPLELGPDRLLQLELRALAKRRLLGLFYERIEPLVRSPKLGPVLWQLPGSFRRDDERLASALAALPPGRHCFEFRHESWFTEDVYTLLRAHGVALVIGDMPSRPFQTHELTAVWTFLRFHYGKRGRNGNYSDRELEAWAQRIEEWRDRGDVYAYFNNDWKGYAIRNGLWLRRRLGA